MAETVDPRSDEEHRADAHHPDGAHLEEHDTGHDDHGDSEHAEHAEPRLGPIDWPAWSAGALGVAVGVVVAALFYLSVTPR